MEVIGYRIKVKFPDLDGVRDFQSTQLPAFKTELQEAVGLVLYHGAKSDMISTLCRGAAERRFAAIVVSTSAVPRPAECVSPYIHFYSIGISNPRPDMARSEDALFQSLVDTFVKLPPVAELDERYIDQLWATVDPRSAVMDRLRALEDAIYAGPDQEGNVKPEHRVALSVFYGAKQLPSYDQVRREYLTWCRERGLKKNSVDGT